MCTFFPIPFFRTATLVPILPPLWFLERSSPQRYKICFFVCFLILVFLLLFMTVVQFVHMHIVLIQFLHTINTYVIGAYPGGIDVYSPCFCHCFFCCAGKSDVSWHFCSQRQARRRHRYNFTFCFNNLHCVCRFFYLYYQLHNSSWNDRNW